MMSDMFHEQTDYRFGIVDTTVFPREMYPDIRRFVMDVVHHNTKFKTFGELAASSSGGMREGWSDCVNTGVGGPLLPIPDLEFTGAFMW